MWASKVTLMALDLTFPRRGCGLPHPRGLGGPGHRFRRRAVLGRAGSRAFPVPGGQIPGASRESLSSLHRKTGGDTLLLESLCRRVSRLWCRGRQPPRKPLRPHPSRSPAAPPGGCYDRGGGQGRPRRQGPGRERASRRVALGIRFRRGAGAPRVPPSCRGGRAGEGKGSVPEAPPTAGFRALAVGVEERRQEKRTEGRSRPEGSREAGGAGGRAPDRRFSTLAAQQHPREPWQVPTPGPPQLTSYPGVSRAAARPGNRSAENHCPPTLGFSDFFPCQLIPLTARWCPLPGKSFCCSRHRLNNPFSL